MSTALALAATGAKGETFDQIKEALHLAGDKSIIVNQFTSLMSRLADPTLGTTLLRTANKIFIDKFANIKEKFNDTAINKFNAEVEHSDFTDKVGLASKINNWLNRNIERDSETIPSEVFNYDTRLVLANSICFKGSWRNPFNKQNTRAGNFHVNENQTKEVTFMTNQNHYRYGELPDFGAKVVELPYANSDVNFLIILPNEVSGLVTIAHKLKDHNLKTIIQKLSDEYVNVTIPKFSLQFSFMLNEFLKIVRKPISDKFNKYPNNTDF